MKFKLEIKCDNAAFIDEGPSGTEVARILRNLSDKLNCNELRPGDKLPLRDANGNTVGEAHVLR